MSIFWWVSLNCSANPRTEPDDISTYSTEDSYYIVQYSMLRLNSSLKKDFGLQSMHWRMHYWLPWMWIQMILFTETLHFASARNKINHLNTQNHGTMRHNAAGNAVIGKSSHWKRKWNVQTIISELIHIEKHPTVTSTAVYFSVEYEIMMSDAPLQVCCFFAKLCPRLCKQIQITRTLGASSQTSMRWPPT